MAIIRRLLFISVLLVCSVPAVLAQDIADLLDQVRPAVVTIESRNAEGAELGTGFLIKEDGTILTAQHVIKDAKMIRVKFSDGKTANVDRILTEDSEDDFALLKIAGDHFPTVGLGDASKLRQGEKIVVVGNPLGLEFTATDGIVSALRDTELHAIQKGDIPAYIQVSAAISPGNSGGPIFNLKGEAVGVAVFKRQGGENLNFALSVNRVLEALKRMQNAAGNNKAGQGESWFVVASKTRDVEQVRYIVHGKDPLADTKWVRDKWALGYAITDIAEGKDRWVVMFSKGTDYTDQSILTDKEFPEDRIKAKWKDNFFITNAVYSGDRWLVVLSKYKPEVEKDLAETYMLGEEFPSATIKEKFEQGYRITIANGDTKKWLIVMTKGKNLASQRYNVFKEVPRDWIRKNMQDGFFITSVGNRNGEFIAVMSQGSGIQDQAYWSGEFFPDEWMKEKWGRGWIITGFR